VRRQVQVKPGLGTQDPDEPENKDSPMERQELREALAGLLEETTGETYPEVGEDQSLTDGLGLDSVDLFSLIVEIQTRFKVKIASEELAAVATVGDLLDVLQAKLAPGGAASAA
jgi:acyl carrier protein